ncbi:MAG TPA: hypothetical protein VJ487_08440 [Alphaproteobacteria bacterium]|nr:hypothetical protein [Alphaproteobacteria bacterium]
MACEKCPFFGSNRGADVLIKIRGLHGAGAPDHGASVPDKDIVDALYNILTILDAKAAGMLTFNSLVTAILAVILSATDEVKASLGVPSFFTAVGPFDMLAFVLSSFFCLFIIQVKWKFFGQVSTETPGDFGKEIRLLAEAVDDRTRCFWLSRYFTLGGMLLLLLCWLLPGPIRSVVVSLVG